MGRIRLQTPAENILAATAFWWLLSGAVGLVIGLNSSGKPFGSDQFLYWFTLCGTIGGVVIHQLIAWAQAGSLNWMIPSRALLSFFAAVLAYTLIMKAVTPWVLMLSQDLPGKTDKIIYAVTYLSGAHAGFVAQLIGAFIVALVLHRIRIFWGARPIQA